MGKRQMREIWIGIGILLVSCFVAISGIRTTVANTKLQEKAQLEAALKRAIVECYAIEGAYPADLTYIEEHYGVVVDKEAFIVDYEAFADNIMPDFKVISLDEEGEAWGK